MGCSHNNRDSRDSVAGAFDRNFKVPVKAFIDGEDFCRAVRRCIVGDLVAGARDDRDDRRNNNHHKNCGWRW